MHKINYLALEQEVLAIYINCPELLLEQRYDTSLFDISEHKLIYTAILKSLEKGEYNAAVYYSNLTNEILDYANKLEEQYISNSQLDNLLEPLRERMKRNKVITLTREFENGEIDIYEISNAIANLSIEMGPSNFVAKKVSDIPKRKLEWLIPGLIEKNEISIFAGDGGTGKTTIYTSIVSDLSTGHKCFFEDNEPNRKPLKVLYLSKEDGTSELLKQKFEALQANQENLITFDLDDPNLYLIQLGTPSIEQVVKANKPDVMIFDPMQSFIDAGLNLGARNQVRQIIDSLRKTAKKYSVTIILVMHANKESKVWGRKRLADSADFWDAARTVLMFGETDEKGINYISHEKHNHSGQHETILFSVTNDGIPVFEGTSKKTDKDYVLGQLRDDSVSKIDIAMNLIVQMLKENEHTFSEILDELKKNDISQRTAERARKQLKDNNKIESFTETLGKGNGTKVVYRLIN